MAKNLKGKINPERGNSLENRRPSGRYAVDGNNRKTKSYGLEGSLKKNLADYDGLITQHEGYAITGRANEDMNFGAQPHNHKNRPNTEPRGGRRALNRDSQRAHPTHPGYHVHPDHGPFE